MRYTRRSQIFLAKHEKVIKKLRLIGGGDVRVMMMTMRI